MKLERFKQYSRKDVHDIFEPNSKYTIGSGKWGLQGVIKIDKNKNDFIFFVTYGHKEKKHIFNEYISSDGILEWQSQPSQKLNDKRIKILINHNPEKNKIYLFLRKNKNELYTYLGLLAYKSHDLYREQPVFFKWQIIDWKDEYNIFINNKKIINRLDNNRKSSMEDLLEKELVNYKKTNDKKSLYNMINIIYELLDSMEDISIEDILDGE